MTPSLQCRQHLDTFGGHAAAAGFDHPRRRAAGDARRVAWTGPPGPHSDGVDSGCAPLGWSIGGCRMAPERVEMLPAL